MCERLENYRKLAKLLKRTSQDYLLISRQRQPENFLLMPLHFSSKENFCDHFH